MTQHWHYIFPVLLLLLLVVLLRKEYLRPDRRRLPWRLAATVIALLSLFFLGNFRYYPAPEKPENRLSKDPDKLPPAFTAAGWQRQLPYLQPLHLQGRFRNTTASNVALKLTFAGQTRDSALIAAGRDSTFKLSTVPPFLGPGVLQLLALAGRDTLAAELVPVIVKPMLDLRVLFLAANPDFENRFLADWLSQRGAAVAMRSRVAATQYATRFSNMQERRLDLLNPALLNDFDLIVTDKHTLTTAEMNGLYAYMQQQDIGMLLKPDSNAARLSPVFHQQGAAQVVTLGRNDTYSWQLSGDTLAYSRYWANIISRAARKSKPEMELSVAPDFPLVSNEITLKLNSRQPLHDGSLLADDLNLPLAGQPMLPDTWNASWWPLQKGWHAISIDQHVFEIYVYGEDDWKGLRPAVHSQESNETIENVRQLAWWWLVPLLLAMIFLWLEKKL
ncbi:hypothetical protein [Chitinophaga sp. Cy-1792]|uniref:hypothetical protein n=1 Tax=Chitinophaga sp. Cy-1792 TaxID=2608339 RepID=UPI00141FCBAE|nr:hypothetical protein [Chitinophaga sp. Cy-1792]NIG54198.1 hypothetical protein [Chitinophaga sp. Cy-1792]